MSDFQICIVTDEATAGGIGSSDTGLWVQLDSETGIFAAEEVAEHLKAVGVNAETIRVTASEGFGDCGKIAVREGLSLAQWVTLATEINDKGEAFRAYYEYVGDNDYAVKHFEEAYRGCHSSVEEYAEQLLDDCGTLSDMPANLKMYFDYAAFARDMESSGDIWTHDGNDGVHVFDETI